MKGRKPKSKPQPLPEERDFDPYGGDLDSQVAWDHFGGLSLAEAAKLFRKMPEVYQEDFMFMGTRAFAYYFPVIDGFLRETVEIAAAQRGDRQAWILAHCIKAQFYDERCGPLLRRLKPDVLRLAEFVRQNLHAFAADDFSPQEIAEAWEELQGHVKDLRI